MTPMKRSRKVPAKNLPLPKSPAVLQAHPSDQIEAPDVMEILMEISSRLQTMEHFMHEAEKEKSASATR